MESPGEDACLTCFVDVLFVGTSKEIDKTRFYKFDFAFFLSSCYVRASGLSSEWGTEYLILFVVS